MKREYEYTYDDVTDLESEGLEEELIQQKIKRLKLTFEQDLQINSIAETSGETELFRDQHYHMFDDSTISTNSDSELSGQTEEDRLLEMNKLLGELHNARMLRRQQERGSSSTDTIKANSIHSNTHMNNTVPVIAPTTPVYSENLPFVKNPSFVYSSRRLSVDTSQPTSGTLSFPETPGSANSANSRMDVDSM
jgi:hypothetical protein